MNEKIKGHQLDRGAYVYVRQSTPYQVRNHLGDITKSLRSKTKMAGLHKKRRHASYK